MKVLRLLWPAPWTLLGLLLGASFLALGGRVRRRQHTLEFFGGRLGRWASLSPFAALTLGHVILATCSAQADRLGPHERSHVRQYEAWGPLFVPAYLLAGAWAWLQGGHAHADNAFERQAVQP